jgi:hypothetical protein
MKYVLNLDEIRKGEIPINMALYLISIYFEAEIQNNQLEDKARAEGYLTTQYGKIVLTVEGINLVEDVFLNSEFKESFSEEDRYDNLAKKLQELFPKGKKPGTNYMWRDSYSIIARKLRTVVKKFGIGFTDEEAILATKKYVDSFKGDYRYMQLLKYFILKKDTTTLEENSQFLSYLENLNDADIDADNPSNDWTIELK